MAVELRMGRKAMMSEPTSIMLVSVGKGRFGDPVNMLINDDNDVRVSLLFSRNV